MRLWLWLVLLTLLLAAPWADTSPVHPEEPKVDASLAGHSAITSLVPCKGGERTVAIAATISKQPVLLALYVYDPHGNCVAWDEYHDEAPPSETRRPATDDVAVQWFPPVEATYTVELRNLSPDPCKLQMAIR
jgi:hypothetical protein